LTLPIAAGPYSQAIRAASQIWVAGQIPADANGELIEGSVAEKTALCCRNIKAVLEAAGSEMGRVVRVGVGLSCPVSFLSISSFVGKRPKDFIWGF
jgi:2-iminobutanoate/2-iminopropanoate deaminase